MSFNTRATRSALLPGVLLMACLLTSLQPRLAGANGLIDDPFYQYVPLSNEEMASLRGGFITADGIEISIGYEQVALINGILKTKQSLDISQLTRRGDTAVALGSSAPVRIIQADDVESSPALTPVATTQGYLTLIQNSLDHQILSNLSVLNIDIKNMPALSPTTFGNLINNQILNSLH